MTRPRDLADPVESGHETARTPSPLFGPPRCSAAERRHVEALIARGSPSMAGILARLTGALFIATLISFTGRWLWAGEMLVNFRTHFVLCFLLALAVALATRRWRVAGVAVIGLALNVWPMRVAFFPPAPQPLANARAVRVAAFNVHVTNESLADIAAYLDSLAADVVVLAELTPTERAEQLANLLPKLPHRYLAENDGLWGVAILSRWPLIAPQPATRDGVRFAARADVDLGDRIFRLYGAHLIWPVMPETARIRNSQLRALGRELAECPGACVVVGDFNVTPWSSHFRDLLQAPGVQDCAAGRGLLTTWSSRLPAMLRIRIDQCLVAGAVSVADVRVGESVESDHFATVNNLVIGGP
jgi:endonuclease/exonuclease/phosphatase (EEP) superfamily protein YafD